MDKNFYCNGEWFSTYLEAEMYANACLECDGKYFAVYTRLEMDSMVKGMVDSVISHAEHVLDCPSIDGFGCHCEDIIDHEMECGK